MLVVTELNSTKGGMDSKEEKRKQREDIHKDADGLSVAASSSFSGLLFPSASYVGLPFGNSFPSIKGELISAMNK